MRLALIILFLGIFNLCKPADDPFKNRVKSSSLYFQNLNTNGSFLTYPPNFPGRLFSITLTESSATNVSLFDRSLKKPEFLNAPFFASDTLPGGKRFLYSNYVMLSSSLGGHLYLYLRTFKTQDWSQKFKWSHIEHTFTLPPEREYDHWTFNYLVHPYMGSLTYLATRNRGGGMFEAYIFSNLNSILYEYVVSSSLHRPSINDMIITPLGGLLVGETIFRIKNRILRTDRLTFWKKIALTIMDPYEVFRYGFEFQKMSKFNQ